VENKKMGTWNSRGLRGSTLEDLVNRTNERYLEKNLALIQKIPTALGVGYDIQSLEGTPDRIKRYIEVKTTISQNRLNFGNFHLTPNEWNSATTLRDRYYVYRLMISKDERTLYILQDPESLYKQNKISMSLSHKSGVEISFSETACTKTALML
jgi:hypothetical protein